MEGADLFVEDILDLSNAAEDNDIINDAFFHSNSTDDGTPVHSSNSPLPDDSHFTAHLSLPYEDMAELEWLSNFVEESFSSDDLHKLQLIPHTTTQFHDPTQTPSPNPPSSVPGKARSKRSRVAPNDWSTRLVMVAPPPSAAVSTSSSESSQNKKPSKRRERESHNSGGEHSEVRRCLHCASEKTPQWRTGPMGPKTLCNACGVRYKSGRLVPEYRPAASPTFVSTMHSNSHRKVVELRRQKEQQQQQQSFIHHHHHQHQSMMMGVSNGGDDYLIHHHLGPDYRQMI